MPLLLRQCHVAQKVTKHFLIDKSIGYDYYIIITM